MNSNEPLPKANGVNKWKTTGRVLLFCISGSIILAISSGITSTFLKPLDSFSALLIAIILISCLTLLFINWEGVSLKEIGMVPGKYTAKRIITGFIIGCIMACLQPLILLLLTSHIKLELSKNISVLPVSEAFVLYTLAAIREEIAFRAYPLRSLNRVLGMGTALLIIAIIFSLEHIAGGMLWWQAFIGAGVGSLLFGVAALYTRGIAMPIGLHMAWNFGQWALGFKDNTGMYHAVISKGAESSVELMGFVSYLLVMLTGISGFYLYWKKSLRKNAIAT